MSSQSKKILLFGKTGDGKSTVANMLMQGDVVGEFAAGNSLAAVTQQTQEFGTSSGTENWTIIDTVGLFASDKPEQDYERIRELRNYLAEKHQAIDVFCYLKKAAKFTRADEQCWAAFQKLFAGNVSGHAYHENVLLVFTNYRRGTWLEENAKDIDDLMCKGVQYKQVGVDFPPHSDDQQIESNLEKKRAASLEQLKAAIQDVGKHGPLPLQKLPARLPDATTQAGSNYWKEMVGSGLGKIGGKMNAILHRTSSHCKE